MPGGLRAEDLDGVKTALGKVGIPLSEINYVVANAGAEMWTVTEDPQNPNDVNIESLDDYDEHIFFR